MGRIISFGWMQMRMSIRDGEFSCCAYFMILRIVQMAVLVLHTDPVSSIERTQTHIDSFFSIYGLEMEVVLCLVELSSTILSHIGLTSNTSDKPILFLSTESSPCPKITLLSLGTQQRRMVSRGVDSSLWHLQYA